MTKSIPIPKTESRANLINRLLKLLNGPAVLIRCAPGTKRPSAEEWQKLTLADMERPEYLATLRTGNIGVSLGEPSGGLCSIDIDADVDVEPFLDLNPALGCTLTTKGKDGCNFWVRITGKYPRIKKLIRTDGTPYGEWRSTGCQTIIHGIHPDTKQPYRIITEKRPQLVHFQNIRWPDGVRGPVLESEAPVTPELSKTEYSTHDAHDTQDSQDLHDSQDSQESQTRIDVGESLVVVTLDSLLKQTTLAGPRSSNRNMFTLARGVKNLEIQEQRSYSEEMLRAVFIEWYKRNLRFLKPNQSYDTYLEEFFQICEATKKPLGECAILTAKKKAIASPLPPDADQFGDPKIRLLVGFCWQLQLVAGSQPFFLSSRKCGVAFEVPERTAATWLKGFVRRRILDLVEMGRLDSRMASSYRYIGKAPL